MRSSSLLLLAFGALPHLARAQAPTQASASSPNAGRAIALLDRAIVRMGGEGALRAITSIRMDVMTQWQRTHFGTHPYADAPSYERHADLRDYATNSWRNTRTFLPGTSGSVDVVRDTVGARWSSGPNNTTVAAPLNVAYVDERRELFAFAPERTLLLARAARDLRAAGDTTIDGVVHARVAATVDGFPATWFLRSTDALPAMVRFTADETNDFGLAPWGRQEVELWYAGWARVAPGVLLPRQRDVKRVGRPYKRMTALAITINAPAPADSFAIDEAMVRRFLAEERRPMWAVSLDSTKIEQEAFATFSPWTGTSGAVRIGGRWVLLETGQAPGASKNVAEWLRATTGTPVGVGIVARVSTGNGGAAWLADQRLPVYVAPGALPVVRHAAGAARLARMTVIAANRWMHVGTDSLWLERVDYPDATGTLVVYSPTLRWLYSPMWGVPTYQAENDALLARLRQRGLQVEVAGGMRSLRSPVAPG